MTRRRVIVLSMTTYPMHTLASDMHSVLQRCGAVPETRITKNQPGPSTTNRLLDTTTALDAKARTLS